jgi:hypothetical protein
MPLFHGNAIPSATGYDIENSCRLNRGDPAYMSRTFSSAGNRRTWTFSAWIKIGNLLLASGNSLGIFGAYGSGHTANIQIDGNGEFHWEHHDGSSYAGGLRVTTAKHRDPTNWYHVMIAYDTTQGTASNRIKLYVNGTHQTDLVSGTHHGWPAQNYEGRINTASEHIVGKVNNAYHWDGYMAEINFIDGTALTPSSFGEVDEDYGHWKPKKLTGLTYGTNGFYLDFKAAGSGTGGAGNDANGSNNFSTAGIGTANQTLDTPTNNFSVINPIDNYYPPSADSATFIKQGNLQYGNTANTTASFRRATFGMDSGKWYWEVLRNNISGSESGNTLGIMPASAGFGQVNNYIGADHPNLKGGIGFYGFGSNTNLDNGGTINQGVGSHTGANTVIGIAYDCATGKFWVSINGTWTGSANPSTGNTPNFTFTDTVITKSPAFQAHNNVEFIANFGQEGTFIGRKTAGGNSDDNGYGNFLYDVPAGFLALCSKNIPEPAVKPRENFHTKLYSGNGSTNAITGVGFTPGLTWIRTRNNVNYNPESYDIARGATHSLAQASNGIEYSNNNTLASFDSDGFTLGAHDGINNGSSTFASWNWKMGGSPSSNTNGTITSNVSANVSAGQSVLTYTGTGSNATVGHGLSQAPDLVIIKRRNAGSSNWVVGTDSQEAKILHSGTFNMNGSMPLNDTTVWTDETIFNDTSPTSTVFSLGGSDTRNNASGGTYVAYCFHNVEGYSKIGAYDSGAAGAESGVAGDISGTMVYTGFKPAFLIIKPFDQGGNGWRLIDGERDSYINPINSHLSLHTAGAITGSIVEGNTANGEGLKLDFLANGFKNRERDSWFNDYRYCYFYYAVASFPFKYSNAG